MIKKRQMRDLVDQKRLALSLQSNLGYEYETNMFSSLPYHSTSLNYDLDL